MRVVPAARKASARDQVVVCRPQMVMSPSLQAESGSASSREVIENVGELIQALTRRFGRVSRPGLGNKREVHETTHSEHYAMELIRDFVMTGSSSNAFRLGSPRESEP
jgi:hypothetical protein